MRKQINTRLTATGAGSAGQGSNNACSSFVEAITDTSSNERSFSADQQVGWEDSK
jgi:hypothetical protein